MSLLPFFWPTQTLILDDDELFIVELKEIYKDKKNIIFSTSTIDSLNYLSNLQFDNQWYKHLLDYGYYEKKLYDIDYKKICNNIYSPERFKQVTTIIVDHNMPSMSGIEFCTKVAQYSNANKILLTANMDYKQAVNHLNQSIINEFYIKQDII
jgi:CheY-like chemotaxis protein